MKTFEDALIASVHIELEHGTQRSVGALYALLLPFMCANFPILDKYVDIHKAIRKQWPGKRAGIDALDKIKKIGWDNHNNLAKQQSSVSGNEGKSTR